MRKESCLLKLLSYLIRYYNYATKMTIDWLNNPIFYSDIYIYIYIYIYRTKFDRVVLIPMYNIMYHF